MRSQQRPRTSNVAPGLLRADAKLAIRSGHRHLLTSSDGLNDQVDDRVVTAARCMDDAQPVRIPPGLASTMSTVHSRLQVDNDLDVIRLPLKCLRP